MCATWRTGPSCSTCRSCGRPGPRSGTGTVRIDQLITCSASCASGQRAIPVSIRRRKTEEDGVTVRGATTRGSADRQASTALAGGHLAAVPQQNGGTLDLAWLVRAAAAGDRAAWERLVDQFSRLLWAMTRDF